MLVLFFLFLTLSAEAKEQSRPNVIVILADDMGYSDLSCYGSEIPTPNLDALAANGLKYTQFYNAGRCCPSRAALITGLYNHQTGIGAMDADEGLPAYQGHLNEQCVTLGEVMKSAGYLTAHVGKWHMGDETPPWKRGFERNLTAQTIRYFSSGGKEELNLNGTSIPGDDPRLPKNWYSTDLWTTFTLKFVDEAVSEKKPFFIYLAHNAPHCPLQAPGEDIQKFRGTYKAGYEAISAARFARQKQLGLVSEGSEQFPRPETVKPWASLTPAEQDRFDHLMATYAACVYHLDLSIGDLVNGLKERGLLDNTILVFMSDNGGSGETGPQGWTKGEDPSSVKSYWRCGESWAFVQNTPFRLYKRYNNEGGISSPLIVHWPAGISAKGEWRSQPGHLIDIMPTLIEISKATYPTNFNGNPILPMEGQSLVPTFTNQPIERGSLYWEHMGKASLLNGSMKLVREEQRGEWELFDISKDRAENHNLAKSDPEKLKTLVEEWEAWAKKVGVSYGKKPKKGKEDER